MTDCERLLRILDRFEDHGVAVVGDLMLDRFIWGRVERISPEAPVPVVQVTRETAHLGGSANVVANIHAMHGRAVPVGVVGDDETGREIIRQLAELGIDRAGLVTAKDVISIQKTRIIAHHQQVCRVDREGEPDLSKETCMLVERRLRQTLESASAVVVSDYGKGVICQSVLGVIGQSKRLAFVDPKDRNFDLYREIEAVTPNQGEAERMSGIKIVDDASMVRAAAAIFKRIGTKRILLTRGEHGMVLFERPSKWVEIPTEAQEVFDVSGAGDTVIATFALCRAAGASDHDAARIANLAAGIVVGKLGTATVTRGELETSIRQRFDA